MIKAVQVKNILKWLKLFTYISATVLLVTKNSVETLTFLIPLAILLSFIDYSRDFLLIEGKKPTKYIWASAAIEMLLIICIGYLDRSDITILFFFVFISSIVISNPFKYAIPPALVFIASGFFIYAGRNGFGNLADSAFPLAFSYGVSTAFVMGMSYLFKMQMSEKEKLARINGELEEAYKKVIENSAAAQQLTIQQERTRMAREIHDTLAHTLTNLIIELEACKQLAVLDPSRLPDELEKAQELSRSGFNDVKRSIKALRPQVMEGKSFFASISSIINETMENTKVHITLNNSLKDEIKLSSQVEVAVFRAIQESITNSIRHGKAANVEITSESQGNMLRFCISDDGIGCTSLKKGYGTKGICERIESLNGNVEFVSSPGKGFRTFISIPFEAV